MEERQWKRNSKKEVDQVWLNSTLGDVLYIGFSMVINVHLENQADLNYSIISCIISGHYTRSSQGQNLPRRNLTFSM